MKKRIVSAIVILCVLFNINIFSFAQNVENISVNATNGEYSTHNISSYPKTNWVINNFFRVSRYGGMTYEIEVSDAGTYDLEFLGVFGEYNGTIGKAVDNFYAFVNVYDANGKLINKPLKKNVKGTVKVTTYNPVTSPDVFSVGQIAFPKAGMYKLTIEGLSARDFYLTSFNLKYNSSSVELADDVVVIQAEEQGTTEKKYYGMDADEKITRYYTNRSSVYEVKIPKDGTYSFGALVAPIAMEGNGQISYTVSDCTDNTGATVISSATQTADITNTETAGNSHYCFDYVDFKNINLTLKQGTHYIKVTQNSLGNATATGRSSMTDKFYMALINDLSVNATNGEYSTHNISSYPKANWVINNFFRVSRYGGMTYEIEISDAGTYDLEFLGAFGEYNGTIGKAVDNFYAFVNVYDANGKLINKPLKRNVKGTVKVTTYNPVTSPDVFSVGQIAFPKAGTYKLTIEGLSARDFYLTSFNLKYNSSSVELADDVVVIQAEEQGTTEKKYYGMDADEKITRYYTNRSSVYEVKIPKDGTYSFGALVAPIAMEGNGQISYTVSDCTDNTGATVISSATQTADVMNTETAGNSHYCFDYVDFKNINLTLKQGTHYIKVTQNSLGNATATGRSSMTDKFYLALNRYADVGVVVSDFSIVTEDNVRVPYSFNKNITPYAQTTLYKGGTLNEELMLILAEYNQQGRLVNTTVKHIDTAEMDIFENKTYSTDLELQGDNGTVKAFLFNNENLSPYKDCIAYSKPNIFSDDILSKTVESQLATETLNANGVNYSEYGEHNNDYDIDAIFYDGSTYEGEQTKVFAYLGIPKNASEESPVPAVVLVHGGLGKAEKSWVKKWNDMGYAAIAMDLYGNGPEDGTNSPNDNTGKLKHPYAGMYPWDDYGTAFLSDYKNAGMYHVVQNIINAHSLIRELPCVDEDKTGITGISWGGVATTIVSGIDSRFKFAAPVYGCGYLDQAKTYFKNSFSKNGTSINWDPANFAVNAEMPVLYINGDNDNHFSINISSSTYQITPNAYLSIRHGMGHSQSIGDSIEQVYDFAKQIFETGSYSCINIEDTTTDNGVMTIQYNATEDVMISNVKTYYLTTQDLNYGGLNNVVWTEIGEYTAENNVIQVQLPENATYCYASITDTNNNVISTEFIKISE